MIDTIFISIVVTAVILTTISVVLFLRLLAREKARAVKPDVKWEKTNRFAYGSFSLDIMVAIPSHTRTAVALEECIPPLISQSNRPHFQRYCQA